ncbi:MAG: 2-amino-4-hydroxy-6-hydroxymethyldihydropteridine diphosphokinase [Rhodoferax sp.]
MPDSQAPAPAPGGAAQGAAVWAYIGFGANLGDARAALEQAARTLAVTPGVAQLQRSRLYRTAPWQSSGPDYLNAVVRVHTALEPQALLAVLQALELAGGRERPYRNAPRTLDLDLLLHGDARLDTPALQIPHPRMWERAFVLHPLRDLAPWLVPPACWDAVASQPIACLGVW